MVFPVTFASVLLAAILSLLFGALWLLPFRATGKWRFELFGLDFSIGVLLASILTGFTLGSMGSEITFFDTLNIVRKSSLLFLFGTGALLYLGMLFLMAAVATSGPATAFLMGISFSVAVAAIGTHLVAPMTSIAFTAVAVALLLIAVALAARAHAERIRQREMDLLQKAIAAGVKGKLAKNAPIKGIALALAAGVCIGVAMPLVAWVQSRDEIQFGAYAVGTILAGAAILGGPFFLLFFLNLPVQGEALSFGAWARGTARQHLLGWASGALWYCGFLGLALAAFATPKAEVSRGLAFAVSHLSMLIAGLLGIAAWGEYANAPSARSAALLSVALATLGTLVFAVAPSL